MLAGERERGRDRSGAPEAVLARLGVLAGDPGRPLEDLVLGRAALPGLGGDAVVDLLEDAGHGGHVRRLHDRQILDDLVDAAVDCGDVPRLDLPGGEHLAEHVGERQPQGLHVVAADQSRRDGGLGHVGPVVVRQAHALGAAGGAGGVDEGGELVPGDRADAFLDQLGVLLQVGGAPALQLVEGEDPVALLGGPLDPGRVDDDHMGQLGQLGALVAGLGELLGVLRDQHPAAGVGEDERRLLGVGLRVDGGRRRAGAQDAEVGEDPLDAGGGGERDPLLGPYAELDEARRDGVHPFGGLCPGERPPVVGPLAGRGRHGIAVGLGVRCGRHALQEEGRHGRRTVLDHGLCVAHDILRARDGAADSRCGWFHSRCCSTHGQRRCPLLFGPRVVFRPWTTATLV